MKYTIYMIFLTITVSLLASCQEESRVIEEVKDMYGRKVTFVRPYSSIPNTKTLALDSIMSKDIKAVSYLENFSCTDCALNKLVSRIEIINSIDKDLGYLIIIRTTDVDELSKHIENKGISHPIMCYQTDAFKVENKLDVLTRNRTFLLDKDNRIVLVGEPFNNEVLLNLYKKAFTQMQE